jgi:hypothetical protein
MIQKQDTMKETVKREHKPYEIQLKEINSFDGEMVYIEQLDLNTVNYSRG